MGNIVVLTGAGISAESGLGTFRDKEGLCAHSDASGQLFRQHPVSHSGVSGHLRIVAT
jgi:NAD-dependent SIR2 family protein deacetylase